MSADTARLLSSAGKKFLRILMLLISPFTTACAQEITLPVRVYLYSFTGAPELSSTLDEKQIRTIFDEVNKVWKAADIHWEIESIVRKEVGEKEYTEEDGKKGRAAFRQKFLDISPPAAEGKVLWKVGFVREFPVPGSGVYLPETRTIYYAEMTRNGETRPVNLAHELGHALGLPHVDELSNLMNPLHGARSNTELKTELTSDQISIARKQAEIGPVEGKGMRADHALSSFDDMHGENGLPQRDPAKMEKRRKKVVHRLQSFDHDGDGIIIREDVPEAGRRAFDFIDKNHDGTVDPEEVDKFSNQ